MYCVDDEYTSGLSAYRDKMGKEATQRKSSKGAKKKAG